MARTKAGRPPGAPNASYDYADEIPPACVKCGSTHLIRVKGSKTIDRAISGVLPSGFRYHSIRWTRKRCQCGQMLIVKTYFPAGKNINGI